MSFVKKFEEYHRSNGCTREEPHFRLLQMKKPRIPPWF